MKYFKTEDGRIGQIVSVKSYNGANPTAFFAKLANDTTIYSERNLVIEKFAYTIEDLVDGFIVENNDNHIWFFMEVNEFKNEKEHLSNWTYTAFIKTDKGLIYVAKMNEKGELELL